MDPVKVEAITTWPQPQTKRDVQSFLGFCNFYCCFIKGYVAIAHPLYSLTGNSPFKWSDNHDSSFTTLRNAITTSPILMIPTDDNPFCLETDASEYAVGTVLSQNVNGVWQPVAFLSKALSQTQQNYAIYDHELLAIMIALQEFCKYLISVKHPFEILTDHANLQYFKQPQKLNHHQAHWLTELQEFHFTLRHVSGISNSHADILSRKPGFDWGVNDNNDTILLPPKLFVGLISPHHLLNSIDIQEISMDETPFHDLTTIEFMPRILHVQHNLDKSVKQALVSHEPDWSKTEFGALTYQDCIYVPIDRTLHHNLIQEHHDTPIAGHPGLHKTLELLLHDYLWPRIKNDVKIYVEGCEMCQRTKPHRTPAKTLLHPFSLPSQPWGSITINIIGLLPESQGFNAILVIVNQFSKAIKLEVITMELTSESTTRILRDQVFWDHGLT